MGSADGPHAAEEIACLDGEETSLPVLTVEPEERFSAPESLPGTYGSHTSLVPRLLQQVASMGIYHAKWSTPTFIEKFQSILVDLRKHGAQNLHVKANLPLHEKTFLFNVDFETT